MANLILPYAGGLIHTGSEGNDPELPSLPPMSFSKSFMAPAEIVVDDSKSLELESKIQELESNLCRIEGKVQDVLDLQLSAPKLVDEPNWFELAKDYVNPAQLSEYVRKEEMQMSLTALRIHGEEFHALAKQKISDCEAKIKLNPEIVIFEKRLDLLEERHEKHMIIMGILIAISLSIVCLQAAGLI